MDLKKTSLGDVGSYELQKFSQSFSARIIKMSADILKCLKIYSFWSFHIYQRRKTASWINSCAWSPSTVSQFWISFKHCKSFFWSIPRLSNHIIHYWIIYPSRVKKEPFLSLREGTWRAQQDWSMVRTSVFQVSKKEIMMLINPSHWSYNPV